MKTTTIKYDEDTDNLRVKAPYDPEFNKMLVGRKELEIQEFDRETSEWILSVSPDDYEVLEQTILDTIGGKIVWI